MATLAEMFIADTQQQNAQRENAPAAWAAAAQVANQMQNAQKMQAEIAQKKQELEFAKFEKVGGWIEAWTKMPEGPASKAFGEKFIPNGIQSLGLQDKIHPLNMEAIQKDKKLALGVLSWVRNGGDPGILGSAESLMEKAPELMQMGAADEIASVAAEQGGAVSDAREDYLKRQAQVEAAGMRAGGTQERFDTKRGDQLRTALADKVNQLGIPDIKVSINELNGVIPGGLSGYKTGTAIPGISGGEAALPTNRLKGKALQVRQAAQSVGNQILKLRSGAAVTDGEAMRTLAELGMVPTIGEGGAWTGLAWKGTTSPEAFVNGMRRVRNIVAAKEKTYKNAYGEQTYKDVVGDVVGDEKTYKLSNGQEYSESKLRKYLEVGKDEALKNEIRKLGVK